MALIFCSHCGKQVSDKATTCPHCNAVLQAGQPQVQPQTVPAEHECYTTVGLCKCSRQAVQWYRYYRAGIRHSWNLSWVDTYSWVDYLVLRCAF